LFAASAEQRPSTTNNVMMNDVAFVVVSHRSSCVVVLVVVVCVVVVCVMIRKVHTTIYNKSSQILQAHWIIKVKMASFARKLVMDKFCMRQFTDPKYTGTRISCSPEEFETRVNEAFENGSAPLIDGYAPFCKHVFIPNFTDVKCGYTVIDNRTSALIKSGYEARQEGELPVMVQWISSSDVEAPLATFLDVILYSREQIILENQAMGEQPPDTDAPWGIISIKGQLCDYELPMQPITMMRNALGKAEGGSGVPLCREKYTESVNFWKQHVAIK
jgi:hypothetical protein